jgi:hypothetical protein
MKARARALAAFLCLLACPASAQAPAPTPAPTVPEKAAKPVSAFGDDKPDCLQWTDGCIICKRQADGAVACSTAGAACVQTEPACAGKPE